jgi:integrase
MDGRGKLVRALENRRGRWISENFSPFNRRDSRSGRIARHVGKGGPTPPNLTRRGSAAFLSRFCSSRRSKAPKHLAEQIQRMIAKETGIDLNAHAFRHLAAMLFLREHPGEYETTRQILGHKDLNTTVRAYCGLEQADALRRLDALIDRHRNIPEKRNDPPPTHR